LKYPHLGKRCAIAAPLFGQTINASLALIATGIFGACLFMRNFERLSHFLAIPVAMIAFVLIASQAGGFVLRKNQRAKLDSSLVVPTKNSLLVPTRNPRI
jgi:hypothetical protein